jgi:hypothetical protein
MLERDEHAAGEPVLDHSARQSGVEQLGVGHDTVLASSVREHDPIGGVVRHGTEHTRGV